MDYGLKLLLNLNSTIRGIWHYKRVLEIWEKKKKGEYYFSNLYAYFLL